MSDLYFIVSKLVAFFIDPRTPLFLMLVGGVVLLWTRWHAAGRIVVTGAVTIALLLGAAPVGLAAIAWLGNRIPPPDRLPSRIDGIVMLGGDINNQLSAVRPVSTGSAPARQIAFADLARRFPDAKLIFAGGAGDPLRPEVTEAGGAKRLLPLLGLDPARVIFDERSRNTYENAVFARELGMPQPGENWILVTSALHMPRAIGTFRTAGWQVIPYPIGYMTAPGATFDWSLPKSFDGSMWTIGTALYEFIGLISYRRQGWTDAWIPAP
ncbi:MAG: YdcF family protein [Alphaproteobacteria bacterium]|nr:YdcF family protein [Alphaproteobacteria bacterium]